jgi:DNA-binding MarR family transcriptional regulator|tara:strand:+ start:880 stop:1419 length:540 start_codon:yes stop_codon:yes gene_type:complete
VDSGAESKGMAESNREVEEAAPEGEVADGKAVYLETLQLIERLHRQFLDVVKVELDHLGRNDVSNVQSLILYNIGDAEMTVGELTSRGYYLGSNVTYNLKKLVENGFLEQERSTYDRRSVRIRLSEKGLALREEIDVLYQRHVAALAEGVLAVSDLDEINRSLRTLERFWSDEINFGKR